MDTYDDGNDPLEAAVAEALEAYPELADSIIERREQADSERQSQEATEQELRDALEDAQNGYYGSLGEIIYKSQQAEAEQAQLARAADGTVLPILEQIAATHYGEAIASLTPEEQEFFDRDNWPELSTEEFAKMALEGLQARQAEVTGQAAPAARAVAGGEAYGAAYGEADADEGMSIDIDTDHPGWYAPDPGAFGDVSAEIRAELQDSD